MNATDLFGQQVDQRQEPARGKRKPTPRRGYAAPPGSGPIGETCKTCAHIARVRHSKTYLKCGLMCHAWTGGEGTDVLAKSPACSKWEKGGKQ